LYPEIVVPESFQDRFTVCEVTCAPVPESEIVVGDPVALLVTVIVPFNVPVVAGPKITLNVRFCPGFNVTCEPAPLRVYPVPLTVIEEISTLVLPVLVIVSLCVDEVPVLMLPNARFVELYESVCVAATPVPANATVVGEFGALLTIFTIPFKLPAVVGANTALNVTLAPGATLLGMLRPLTV